MTLFYCPLSIAKLKQRLTQNHAQVQMVNTVESEVTWETYPLYVPFCFSLLMRAIIILTIISLVKLQLSDVYCHLIIQIMLQNQVRICKMPLVYENYSFPWHFPFIIEEST